jgi:hypothetical protein
MRKFSLLLLAALALAGCAPFVETTLTNPSTGRTATCSGVLPDINLWSQYPLCRQSYVSAGYQQTR